MKIKLIFILILVAFCFFSIKAQNDLLFQMPVTFEDAKGNKATIIFGYKTVPINTKDSISISLGEDLNTAPLDSVFDIRIGKSGTNWDSPILGTKRLSLTYNDSPDDSPQCVLFGYLFITMQVKYNPVKITYDPTLLEHENVCLQNMVISKNIRIHLPQFWETSPKEFWYCMSEQKEIVLDTREQYEGKLIFDTRKYTVKGKGIQDIPTLQLKNFLSGPCNYYVSNEDVPVNSMLLSPNPVSTDLYVQHVESGTQIEIFDMLGKLQETERIENEQDAMSLDVSSLATGMYVLQVSKNGRLLQSQKFIKID